MIRHLEQQLRAAQKAGTLVSVTRRLEASWKPLGFVVALGKDWVVLQIIEEAYDFWGYSAVRLRDLKQLASPPPHVEFYEEVLRIRGLRRSIPRGLDASSIGSLLRSANKRFPLVTIHDERTDRGSCSIGCVVDVTPTRVELQEIRRGAVWTEAPVSHRLAPITRVDFDGPYERALAMVGGKPPRISRA